MKLILASTSPRRAELLREAGIAFEILMSQIDESRRPNETAAKMVARLAEAKARAAAEAASDKDPAIIIGADTAVELDGEIFGKPRDAADAREMLSYLSGRTHYAVTGIYALRLPEGAARSAVETTAVTFARLDQKEIDAYVASGEPLDKAGGYAIQGRAGRYIPSVEGCYFNVVGLPLARLYALLGELGWRDDAADLR
jgi:nucleoside triphosphate pyrophosphatase